MAGWRGEVRSARRKGWTAAHAPLRRAVRSAAAHAARHALSTSRSVLRTDHLRTDPSYLQASREPMGKKALNSFEHFFAKDSVAVAACPCFGAAVAATHHDFDVNRF